MSKTKLPFKWQDLYDWYASRHYQPAEAYTESDRFWRALAPLILNEMTNGEVKAFAASLTEEYGEYQGRPDIPDRVFPRCLSLRLTAIAYEEKWLSQHQGPEYRIIDFSVLVALYVHPAGTEWMWEVIHGNLIDTVGTAKTEAEAWKAAVAQGETSRARLSVQGKKVLP